MSLPTELVSVVAPSMTTAELMRGKNELIIIHNKQRYTLRITRNGKLILTK